MRPLLTGFGLGLRSAFLDDLPRSARAHETLDWVEFTPENWLTRGGAARRSFDACVDRWPSVPHSISLSLGDRGPFDHALIEHVSAFCERHRCPFWSDHIALSRFDNAHLNELFPVPFSDAMVDHLADRVERVRALTDAPLALENASFYLQMPGATMDEADFLLAVTSRTRCPLLLDVNNVYVNSQNHGYDPVAFLDRIPMDRVCQIHLAGHSRRGGLVIDTHVGPVPEAVWRLYAHAIRRARREVPTLLEWDADLPPLDALLDEVDRARRVCTDTLAALTRGGAAEVPSAFIALVSGRIDSLNGDRSEALTYYARQCRRTRREAVEGVFPSTFEAVLRCADLAVWESLVELYFRDFPMRAYDLADAALGFARWLPGRVDPWVCEVADYESCVWRADTGALEDDGDDGALRLSQNAMLRRWSHDVLSWCEAPTDRAEALPTAAVLWRDREGDGCVMRLDEGTLALLDELTELATDERVSALYEAGVLRGQR